MYIWPYSPNWRTKPLDLTLSFDTMIIDSRNGSEARISRRLEPRLKIAYQMLRMESEALALREALKTKIHSEFAVPIWSQPIEGFDDNGELSIDKTKNRWLKKGSDFYITDGYNSQTLTIQHFVITPTDTLQIELMDGQTLHPAMAAIIAGGDKINIYPVLPVRMSEALEYTAQTSRALEQSITFEDLPGEYAPPVLTDPIYPLLNGKEVFDWPVNWIKAPSVSMDANRVVIDNGRGRPSVHYPAPYASEIKKVKLTLFNQEEINAFIDFFIRMRGRQGSFYFPSGEKDFDAVVSGSLVRLEGDTAVDLFKNPSTARGLSFRLGEEYVGMVRRQNYYHSVVVPVFDVDGGDNRSHVLLQNQMTPSFDLTNAERVSMLYIARFATDNLTISYVDSTRAEIEVAIQTIPFEE